MSDEDEVTKQFNIAYDVGYRSGLFDGHCEVESEVKKARIEVLNNLKDEIWNIDKVSVKKIKETIEWLLTEASKKETE